MKIQTPFQQFKEKYFENKIDSDGNGYIMLEEFINNNTELSIKIIKVNVLNFYNKFHEFQEISSFMKGGFKIFRKIQ